MGRGEGTEVAYAGNDELLLYTREEEAKREARGKWGGDAKRCGMKGGMEPYDIVELLVNLRGDDVHAREGLRDLPEDIEG